MNEKDVLDAPENEEVSLKITLKSVLLTALAFVILYPLYFAFDSFFTLSSFDFTFWKFQLDLSKIVFVLMNCIGLYVFTAMIRFELRNWFRVMTISIFIVLIGVIVGLLFILGFEGISDILDYSTFWESQFYKILKIIAFISLVVGGGCSLAVQFLHKKNYLIFFVMTISTLAVFSLIEYL